MGESVQIPHDSSGNRVNWKRIAIFVAIQCGQTFKQSIYWLSMRRLPAVEKNANVTMDSRAKSIETGRLTTGQLWAVVKSKANLLPQGKGEHYVLHAPRDENNPEGDALARHELTDSEKMELWFEADRQAMMLSRKLSNPDYYRVECNGIAATHRDPLHIHIIIAKKGLEFHRSTDRVDLSLGSLANFLKNYLFRRILSSTLLI